MEKVNSEKSFLLSLFSSMPLCPVEAASITGCVPPCTPLMEVWTERSC